MSDATALGPEGITRFLVVCGPRTGSNMLCSALNSHPRIVCFREVFNFMYEDVIDYYVEGYDHRKEYRPRATVEPEGSFTIRFRWYTMGKIQFLIPIDSRPG